MRYRNPPSFGFVAAALLLFSETPGFRARAAGPSATAEQRNRGVHPHQQPFYDFTNTNTFTCLDGSRTIAPSSVNDDYCDCADASDEPGTSACPNGKFYCHNTLHVAGQIHSSRVNDGVCDPECCDGSDEYDGRIECPNICEATGALHGKLKKELEVTQREGYAIKKQYIEKGKQLKLKRQTELGKLQIRLNEATILATSLKVEKERAEKEEELLKEAEKANTPHVNPSNASGEKSKLAACRIRLHDATEKLHVQNEYIKNLLSVLHDLKRDHNQNYNDGAVKNAIKGYEELLNEVPEAVDEDLDTISDDASDVEYDGGEETPKQPESQSAAQTAFNDASAKQLQLESDIRNLKDKLNVDYGKDEEWASLDGECPSLDTGEYTYEVCLFGKAVQKSTDGTTVSLGSFDGWDTAVNVGATVNQIVYRHGMRCWNGPERSIKLTLECGTSHVLLDIAEPEKCEYTGKLITPAVCQPLDDIVQPSQSSTAKTKHEEL